MRLIKRLQNLKNKIKSKQNLPAVNSKSVNNQFGQKIVFACDAYLLEKIKNALQSQHLAGNYQFTNLSQVIRESLQAYQQGMTLTVQRQPNNPRRELSLRLPLPLYQFYSSLPPRQKTSILERSLATYCQKYLFN